MCDKIKDVATLAIAGAGGIAATDFVLRSLIGLATLAFMIFRALHEKNKWERHNKKCSYCEKRHNHPGEFCSQRCGDLAHKQKQLL